MNVTSITTNEFGTAIFHTDDGRALAYGGIDANGNVAVIQVHDTDGTLVDGPSVASIDDPIYAELRDALVKGPGGMATWASVASIVAGVLTGPAVDVGGAPVTSAAQPQQPAITHEAELSPAATNADGSHAVVPNAHVSFLNRVKDDVKAGARDVAELFRAIERLFGHVG